jgi:hypothetical protein
MTRQQRWPLNSGNHMASVSKSSCFGTSLLRPRTPYCLKLLHPGTSPNQSSSGHTGKRVGRHCEPNQPGPDSSATLAPTNGADKDRSIGRNYLRKLVEQSSTGFGGRNVIVIDGKAHLWGLVGSPTERTALIAIAEGVPRVTDGVDEMKIAPASLRLANLICSLTLMR